MSAAIALFVIAALALLAALVARARGAATTVVAGAVGVTILVAAAGVTFLMVRDEAGLADADGPVLGWLVDHRSPGPTAAARVLSSVGGTVPTAMLALLSAAVLAVCGLRWAAVVWVVGVVVGALAVRLLKIAVERPRPPVASRLAVETTASLPSGHSLMAALGLGLTAVAVGLVRPAARVGAAVLAVAIAAAIGASRAYLGVHWTTDVLAGWLLGAAVVLACRTATTGSPGVVRRRPVGPGGTTAHGETDE